VNLWSRSHGLVHTSRSSAIGAKGDIVLVYRTADAEAYGIQASPAASFNLVTRAGSAWSHAAIYIGGGMVVDAALGAGVSAQSI